MPSITARESTITHCHPISGQVAQAVTTILRALIEGEEWSDAVKLAKGLPGIPLYSRLIL